MQLWRHKNGIYYLLYGPGLKRRVSTRTADRGEADKFLAQAIHGAQNPLIVRATVGEVLAAYEADAKQRVRGKDILFYSVRALTERLGDLRIPHLLPSVIRQYAKERGTKPGSIMRELGVLGAALNWAVQNRWITVAEKPVISSPVSAPAPRDRWMTKEEVRRLLVLLRHNFLRRRIDAPRRQNDALS
jgi:hypothetical protein